MASTSVPFFPGLSLPIDPVTHLPFILLALVLFVLLVFLYALRDTQDTRQKPSNSLHAYIRFVWGCFLKPHTGDGTRNQQDALESFYQAQASVYDATRARLLSGRDDMLALVAAQLKYKVDAGILPGKPIWIDQMAKFLDVPEFFRSVYVVDLSPSLCEIARNRFARLGWKNVKVVCQDARSFRVEDHEVVPSDERSLVRVNSGEYAADGRKKTLGAELVTISYALSMIPEYYSAIDSISSQLSPNGIVGVIDFYVQSRVEFQSRNYVGGVIDRHCMWLSRVFWRTWFEIDRVNLEPARRDYLEYKFGTILNINARNHLLGVRIPYYVWIGCSKDSGTSPSKLAEVDAAATESPFLSALDLQARTSGRLDSGVELHSKAYESAIVNLAASLPLPASWYQNHHWRIYYDAQLPKHRQFKDQYIYAFTWEDSREDAKLLQVKSSDVILAITSAGDNILSFALEKPKRIHAVDLNPTQNHLLELKVAAFTALGYADVWKIFGEGKHEAFRDLLINKLSPHMSSLAFEYWLRNGPGAFAAAGKGLYATGGSGQALQLVGWILRLMGLSEEVKKLCAAGTLNEQREIWNRSVRKVLLSRLLSWGVISNEKWLWKALGVPPNQRNLIEQDFVRLNSNEHPNPNSTASSTQHRKDDHSIPSGVRSGHAIWEYAVNTLDPLVQHTLLSSDNHYYLLTLLGHYTQRSHPTYLSPKAHIKLSKPGAFDGLRIHTDELNEVFARMSPGTLTIAVVMDSMDWFDEASDAAADQVRALNRALRMGGRVMLRSAALAPWYVRVFEANGFRGKRVSARMPGACVDRVNMYASTWICTKVASIDPAAEPENVDGMGNPMERLKI
ncbi:betaine lipid synthase [Phyllosticta citribraziliensis]